METWGQIKARKGLKAGTNDYWREWQRWRHNRKPLVDSIESFWKRVGKSDECWSWKGKIGKQGYGRCTVRIKGVIYQLPHRVAYTLLAGQVPLGLTLDHLCFNKLCVNPAHLEPVTIAENIYRATLKRTHCKHGHPYKENAFTNSNGNRECHICRKATLERYERKRRGNR